MQINEQIIQIVPVMTEWRHFLHAHPETAFEELQTSEYIASTLASCGIGVHRGLGKTGVVGTLRKGDAFGRAIGLRADIDALDISEENTSPYKSVYDGKMHACGHDGHTAMLLGAAKYLSKSGAFNGTIHFIFQPGEENEGGGKTMVEDGLFDLFPCDAVYGMHNFPMLPLGCFALRPGPMMAAYDVFNIQIKGVGGHAAMPHLMKDPMLTASYMIGMFQSIISRNVNPIESAVLSVTKLNAGTNYNIIPNVVTLQGTTRHFQPYIQDMIEVRMKEMVAGISMSMGVNAEIRYERRYPATVNSEEETGHAIRAASHVVGEENVIKDLPPLLGSEDFAFMLAKRPGAYIGIGYGEPRKNGMLHQPEYDFNDALLPIGAAYWANLVEMLLPATV
jgi:amidohydrolase